MKKILVIEDDLNIRESVCELLEMKNYEISSARNGREGLKLVSEYNPDLILCDIMMPELTGHEVLETIRNENDFINVPFIFMTAKSQKSDIREGMNLGADDYITKPFRAEDLFTAVETRLKKAEAIEANKTQVIQTIKKDLIQNGIELPIKSLHNSSKLLLKYYDVYSQEEIMKYVKDLNISLSKVEGSVKKLVLHQAIQLSKYEKEVKTVLSDEQSNGVAERIRARAIKATEINERFRDLFIRQLDDTTVSMPEQVLDVVVGEIMNNAFKYSKKGTLVTINGINTDKGYQLSIKDKGAGLHQNTMDSLGDLPWRRGDRIGLGVYLASQLIKINGGTLKIDSKRGEGTDVTLFFKTI